jgi:hypothetical protein
VLQNRCWRKCGSSTLPSPHRTLVAPTVGFVRTQVEKGRFVIVCSPTSNRGADATESCTTNGAHCSPQQFAHAPTPSSPRFRFACTEHLPTHSEDAGLSPVVRELCWVRCPFSVNVRRSNKQGIVQCPARLLGVDNRSRGVERHGSWDPQPVRYGVSCPPLSSQSSSSRRTHQ